MESIGSSLSAKKDFEGGTGMEGPSEVGFKGTRWTCLWGVKNGFKGELNDWKMNKRQSHIDETMSSP